MSNGTMGTSIFSCNCKGAKHYTGCRISCRCPWKHVRKPPVITKIILLIYMSINGRSCGHYHSPGDYGCRRGIYTPDFWQNGLTPYGKLVTWEIYQEGTFINGERVSNLRIEELQVFIQNLQIRTHLLANTSSNFYPVTAFLPKEREKVISELQHILDTVDEAEMLEYRNNLKSLG